jgi:predicted metal-dependent peptidase
VKIKLLDLIRRSQKETDGYSRGLQVARVRAAYQRSYFAPALFSLVPVATDEIGSMAVDVHWRLYYNETWVATHTVEENATLLIHEVSHLLRDHEARKKASGEEEGLPLPGNPPTPAAYGLVSGNSAEVYYDRLETKDRGEQDCGSGSHGERRFWEMPGETDSGVPGVDRLKAELVRREVARRIDETSPYTAEVSLAWRRWAKATLKPKVDYMATIRHAVRRALRDSTLGRYDRTYRRPHRRQAAYGEFIMASFHQPRPRPGFLIDTSSSMEDTQLARAVTELGALTRQLGYGADVVVACCDAAVLSVKRVFAHTAVQLYGGGGTDMRAGLRAFTGPAATPVDVLFIVSDCLTPWPDEAPPFPVVTIRIGDGVPPPWGKRGSNTVITIRES